MKVTPLLPVVRVDASQRNAEAATQDVQDAWERLAASNKEEAPKRREEYQDARDTERRMQCIAVSILESEYGIS